MLKLNLNTSLFWDVEITEIDEEKNSLFIINRVLLNGTIKDWEEIKAYYGIEKIKQEVIRMKYLDHKTLNFCSLYFNIQKNDFKCYNTPPSTQELWNY